MSPKRQFVPAHTKTRRLRIAVIVGVIAVIFLVPVLRSGLRRGTAVIGAGVSQAAHATVGFFGSIGTGFRSKNALAAENAALAAQNAQLAAENANETMLAGELADLKASMGRTDPNMRFTLAAVIAKPPESPYDTLVVDGGASVGLAAGQTVYADGDTPIGTVAEVLPESAVVRLYSSPGQATDARLAPSNTDITLTGRGGGNFSATVPQGLAVADGATAVSKELVPTVLAVFEKVTSDPRDPFQTVLFASPLNVNGLAFVQVLQ